MLFCVCYGTWLFGDIFYCFDVRKRKTKRKGKNKHFAVGSCLHRSSHSWTGCFYGFHAIKNRRQQRDNKTDNFFFFLKFVYFWLCFVLNFCCLLLIIAFYPHFYFILLFDSDLVIRDFVLYNALVACGITF